MEGDKSFYGTRVGPGWYQTGTRVARGRELPFSVLRILMQAGREPPPTEGRRRNAECRKAGQSHPKPLQCDIKATPKPIDMPVPATAPTLVTVPPLDGLLFVTVYVGKEPANEIPDPAVNPPVAFTV